MLGADRSPCIRVDLGLGSAGRPTRFENTGYPQPELCASDPHGLGPVLAYSHQQSTHQIESMPSPQGGLQPALCPGMEGPGLASQPQEIRGEATVLIRPSALTRGQLHKPVKYRSSSPLTRHLGKCAHCFLCFWGSTETTGGFWDAGGMGAGEPVLSQSDCVEDAQTAWRTHKPSKGNLGSQCPCGSPQGPRLPHGRRPGRRRETRPDRALRTE